MPPMSLAWYAPLLIPSVCDDNLEVLLLLLAIGGATVVLLDTVTVIRAVRRTPASRRIGLVMVALTIAAFTLTAAYATEKIWYGNGVLLNCGLAMPFGALDQAPYAGQLMIGMVLGIFLLLVVGRILTVAAVRRKRRLGQAGRHAEEQSGP